MSRNPHYFPNLHNPTSPASPASPHPPPPTSMSTSALIFPHHSRNIAHISASLSRSQHSLHNRLLSIAQDAEFVGDVVEGLVSGCEGVRGLGVVANERCGGCPLHKFIVANTRTIIESGGEKEHAEILLTRSQGQWSFSLRRLNLQIFDVIAEYGGCVIIDSTRRGKHLPDALAKTIPIWCAVFNRLLFPSEDYVWLHGLERLSEVVGGSEHAQMEARLEGFVAEAKKLNLDLPSLRMKLNAPLRPLWIVRSLDLPSSHPYPKGTLPCGSANPEHEYRTPPYHPIYLLMASHHSPHSTSISPTYVQGAGDDAESWAHGLTAPVFWAYKDLLLDTPDDELLDVIRECCDEWKEIERSGRDVNGAAGEGEGGPARVAVAKAPWLSIGELLGGESNTGCDEDEDERPKPARSMGSWWQKLEEQGKLVIVCASPDWTPPWLEPVSETASPPVPQPCPEKRSENLHTFEFRPQSPSAFPCHAQFAGSGESKDAIEVYSSSPNQSKLPSKRMTNILHLPCNTTNTKLGARDLRTHLPLLAQFIQKHVTPPTHASTTTTSPPIREIHVYSPPGTDLAIAVALAILCLWSDDNGNMVSSAGTTNEQFTKELVRRRLSWIVTAVQGANPSRAILNVVNEFLMGPRRGV